MITELTPDLDREVLRRFATAADDARVARTAAALESNGIAVLRAADAAHAGHPIAFGLSLYPSVDQLIETRQLAKAAGADGLDYLAIQDHAYNPEFLDVWTLISYLAAETQHIAFFPASTTSSARSGRPVVGPG